MSAGRPFAQYRHRFHVFSRSYLLGKGDPLFAEVFGRTASALRGLATLLACALLLGACASAGKEREDFLGDDRPQSASAQSDTGSCRPFFISPSKDWGEGAPRHSCWNRLWEVPAALVAVPVALAVLTAPVWVSILLLN